LLTFAWSLRAVGVEWWSVWQRLPLVIVISLVAAILQDTISPSAFRCQSGCPTHTHTHTHTHTRTHAHTYNTHTYSHNRTLSTSLSLSAGAQFTCFTGAKVQILTVCIYPCIEQLTKPDKCSGPCSFGRSDSTRSTCFVVFKHLMEQLSY
jgi:hypothetical protein